MLQPVLDRNLQLPIQFPAGTAGYGFTMRGQKYIEVEDWMEQGRTISLRLRTSPSATSAAACEVNDHQTLSVHRDGAYWSIDLPLRPGDGDLVCVQESHSVGEATACNSVADELASAKTTARASRATIQASTGIAGK